MNLGTHDCAVATLKGCEKLNAFIIESNSAEVISGINDLTDKRAKQVTCNIIHYQGQWVGEALRWLAGLADNGKIKIPRVRCLKVISLFRLILAQVAQPLAFKFIFQK